jgi:N-acetylmuramoyl-L-alanine amidase
MSLKQRVDFANQESFPPNQSIFLSLHCNSFRDQRIHGMESFKFDLDATDDLAAELVERENAQEAVDKFDFMIINLRKRGNEKYTEQVARILQELLVDQLGVKNRNLNASRNIGVRGAPFYVLAWTKMPSILLELGFMSNDVEREKMTEEKYQRRIASALVKGIKKFDRQLQ